MSPAWIACSTIISSHDHLSWAKLQIFHFLTVHDGNTFRKFHAFAPLLLHRVMENNHGTRHVKCCTQHSIYKCTNPVLLIPLLYHRDFVALVAPASVKVSVELSLTDNVSLSAKPCWRSMQLTPCSCDLTVRFEFSLRFRDNPVVGHAALGCCGGSVRAIRVNVPMIMFEVHQRNSQPTTNHPHPHGLDTNDSYK